MHPELSRRIQRARQVVALTGAGVSTLSGLPDFRGKNGLYQNPDATRIFDLDQFHEDPAFYYRACRELLYAEREPPASLVHQALARLESEGKLKAVITQNIDLLHQKAGSRRVIEIHGSPAVHHCLACDRAYPYEEIRQRVQAGDIPPRCACGGAIKPDITFFGENLPADAWDQAVAEASQADLLLVLGTSLTVFPAASLPSWTVRNGGQLIIVNEQPTEWDKAADLVLRDLEQAF